mgnify:CR=1 FL=1
MTTPNLPDISVITATYNRPKWLKNCCEQLRAQTLGNVTYEHVIVSDGPDKRASQIAQKYGARFHALNRKWGRSGSACRDFALKLATGRQVVFFDDDNIYAPHALVTLLASAQGVDIGICQTIHKGSAIPTLARETFQLGNIDSMCFCVNARIARKSKWRVANKATDWAYLQGLLKHNPTFRLTPIVIGEHLT